MRLEVTGDSPPPIEADEARLKQAVINLAINAIQATPSGGAVMLSVETEADALRLVVEDTGPGIPAHILDRIFNPFFTTKDSGTGLGLAIVHRAVEAHNGTIHASNADGGGAKFEIRI